MAELYLTSEEQKTRRIVMTHCEDESCGFGVEFKHPNSTFYFCKEHKRGVNFDLNNPPKEGTDCLSHGKTERYDLVKGDNVCPSCEKMTLAVLSVGRE